MRFTDPRLGGTQFSAYMAATHACEAWSTVAAGRLVPRFGYGGGFTILALVSLVSLPLLALLRHAPRRDVHHADRTSAPAVRATTDGPAGPRRATRPV